MRAERKSTKKEIVAFAISVIGAVLAALDLHGWHMYLTLRVTAAVAIVAAIFLARKLRRPSSSEVATAT